MAELTIYEGKQALAERSGENYKVICPLNQCSVELERGTDFDVIPGTKQPTLLKSGAEKVVSAYGLFVHYSIESKIEELNAIETDKGFKPVFFYNVRCDLVKVANNGTEYVFSSGFGSANTCEKRKEPWFRRLCPSAVCPLCSARTSRTRPS